jgi:eukaryotic-like serine/threonine-protein kinase
MGSPDPSLPLMLGRYALYEKIASGGMASVHIGRLLGPVGFARTVAIKRMHPQFAEDPEFVSMFLDEARLASRVRHPNVVPTLDVVAMSGELFLVMDFVQGESLARLNRAASARGERIAPEMATAIIVGALHGLHAAHEAKNDRGEPLGIVHRDVSPHNILVGTDGVARVLDFGVAKAVGRLQTTRDGQLKGKLSYMAPEQVHGDGTRTIDVYAASVVFWEMLTGKRLFQGENEAQLLAQVVKGSDVPPSKLVPGLPAVLDEVTMRGLSVDPAKRFPTARDMARALEDAMHLAPASRIGDWVEAAARQTLDQRSARIASIESDSSVHSMPVGPASSRELQESLASAPSLATLGLPAPSVDIHVETDEAVRTQLSSGSVSRPRPSMSGGKRRNMGLVAAGGAGTLLVVAMAVALLRQAGPAASSAPTPFVDVPPTAAPQPALGESSASSSPPPAASSATAAAPPLDSASSTAAASAHPAASARPSVRPQARPASAAPPSCDPPYTLDAQGRKYFKPECFK